MFKRFTSPERAAQDTAAGVQQPEVAGSAAETATARQIVARLDAMPPTDARYLACFAYVMSRAAQADRRKGSEFESRGHCTAPLAEAMPYSSVVSACCRIRPSIVIMDESRPRP